MNFCSIVILLGLAAFATATVPVSQPQPHYICAKGDTRIAPQNTLPAILACLVEFYTIDASLAGLNPRIEVSMMALADGSVLLNHDEQVYFDAKHKLVIQNPTIGDMAKFPLINIRSYSHPLVSTWSVVDRNTGNVAKLAFFDQLAELLQIFTVYPGKFILDYDIKDAEFSPPAVSEFLGNLNITTTSQLDSSLSQLIALLEENLPTDVTSNAIFAAIAEFPALIPHSLLESTNPLIELDLYLLTQAYGISDLRLAFNYGDWGSALLNDLELGILIPSVTLETTLGLTEAIFFESYLTAAGGALIVQAYHAAGVLVIGVPTVSNDFAVLISYGVDFLYLNVPGRGAAP